MANNINTNGKQSYALWEEAVANSLSDKLEISYSDAQGIIESNEFYMAQAWAKGMDAKQTADFIDSKSSMAIGGEITAQNNTLRWGNLVKSKNHKSDGIGRIVHIDLYKKEALVYFKNRQIPISWSDLTIVPISKTPKWMEEIFGENRKRIMMKWNGKVNGNIVPNNGNEPEPDTDMLDYYDSRISSDPSLKDNIKYPQFDDEYEFEKSSRNEPDTEMLDFYSEKGGMMANGGGIHKMSEKDRARLDVLQSKEDYHGLSESENDEYEKLVLEYRKTPEYKYYGKKEGGYAKGGKVKFDKTLISSLPKRRRADRKYTHFAVRKSDNKILNGWDYSEYDSEDLNSDKQHYFYYDMDDMDVPKSEYTIKKAQTLIRLGVNPFDFDNWRNLDFSNDKPYVESKMANGGGIEEEGYTPNRYPTPRTFDIFKDGVLQGRVKTNKKDEFDIIEIFSNDRKLRLLKPTMKKHWSIKLADEKYQFAKGGNIDEWDEEQYPSRREMLESILTKEFGSMNQYSGSADWGGIPVWSLSGDDFEGAFIGIGDDDGLFIVEREQDYEVGDTKETEIMTASYDEIPKMKRMIAKAKTMQGKMAKGGGVGKGYKVFNYTDDIFASDKTFSNRTKANDFIKEFRKKYEGQGYYRDNRMRKIDVKDIDLLAIPSDFNPYKKMANGGGIETTNEDRYNCYTTGYDGRKNTYGNEDDLTLEDAVDYCWRFSDVKRNFANKEDLEKEIKSTPYGKDNVIASSGNITGVVVYKLVPDKKPIVNNGNSDNEVVSFFKNIDYSKLPPAFAEYIQTEVLTDADLQYLSPREPIFLEIKSKVEAYTNKGASTTATTTTAAVETGDSEEKKKVLQEISDLEGIKEFVSGDELNKINKELDDLNGLLPIL